MSISWPDIVNGLFELFGGVMIFLNCLKIYQDKMVRGIHIGVTIFFTSWGWWNLYYYPSLNQWVSFTGGLLIVSANMLWISMAVYYTRRERLQHGDSLNSPHTGKP